MSEPIRLRAPGAGPSMYLTANGSGLGVAKDNPADARQWFVAEPAAVGHQPPWVAPAVQPPVPVPAPVVPPAPATVPLTPASVPLGPIAVTNTGSYFLSHPVDQLRAINNNWGAKAITGKQAVGLVPGVGGADLRMMWDYPSANREVLAYPEVTLGRTASAPPVAGSALPKRVSDLQSLTTRYTSVEGDASGQGHLSYDLWVSSTPDNMAGGSRQVEIMLPELAFGGYGVPAPWEPAGMGRSPLNLGAGRNPSGHKGRFTIGGEAYDVYQWPGGDPATGLAWSFVVFAPVVYGGRTGKARDWMPLLAFLVGKGWVRAEHYLNAVEFGIEPISNGKPTKGDITVRGVRFDAA